MYNLSIITGFSKYLRELNEFEDTSINTTNVSIFTHSEEFKDYLIEELGVDKSIQSKSVNEILTMDFRGGKLDNNREVPDYFTNDKVELNENNEYVINIENIEADDESNIYQNVVSDVYGLDYESQEGQYILEQLTYANEENDTDFIKLVNADEILSGKHDSKIAIAKANSTNVDIADVLNEVIADENMLNRLDNNNDSEISAEEMNEFIEIIKNLDGNDENVSLEDIFKGIEEFKNEEITETPEENIEQPPQTNISSGAGGSYNGNSSNINNNNTQTSEKALDKMSEAELNQELNTQQKTLNEKQDELKEILNGNNSQLQTLEKTMNDSYNALQEKLKTIDEEMSTKLEEAVNNVKTQQETFDQLEMTQAQQEINLSNCETNYLNAQNRRINLEKIVTNLESTNTNDLDANAQNDLASKLAKAKQEVENAKNAEKDALKAKDEAKKALDDTIKQKEQVQIALNEYKTIQNDIENQIATLYPELKAEQDTYKKAKEEYESFKSTQSTQIKNAIAEKQNRINEINKAIQEKKNSKDALNYSLSPLSMYDEETGAKIAQKILELSEGRKASGDCGKYVRLALEALGYSDIAKCKGKEWAETNLENNENFVEITQEISYEDIKNGNVPIGAIICYSQYNSYGYGSGKSGHVAVVVEYNGKICEASDYIREEGINTNMISKGGASYRIFVPKA